MSMLCLYVYPVSYCIYGDADLCDRGTLSEDIYIHKNTTNTLHKKKNTLFSFNIILHCIFSHKNVFLASD